MFLRFPITYVETFMAISTVIGYSSTFRSLNNLINTGGNIVNFFWFLSFFLVQNKCCCSFVFVVEVENKFLSRPSDSWGLRHLSIKPFLLISMSADPLSPNNDQHVSSPQPKLRRAGYEKQATDHHAENILFINSPNSCHRKCMKSRGEFVYWNEDGRSAIYHSIDNFV